MDETKAILNAILETVQINNAKLEAHIKQSEDRHNEIIEHLRKLERHINWVEHDLDKTITRVTKLEEQKP